MDVVQKSFGRLESTEDPIITLGWFLTTVKVPLQLQHAEFGIVLPFTSAGGLIGLHFTGLGKEWQSPSYADKEAAEIDLVLGQGKFNVGATLCLPRYEPCDRDSTIGENKPFKDLAIGLAGHGIASIRFDKVAHTYPKAFRSLKAEVTRISTRVGFLYWDIVWAQWFETTQGLKCPVLVTQGCRNYQVTVQDDYEKWHAAICGKSNVRLRLYEELNHIFVAGTGLSTPLEYSVQGNVDERVV
ncbi:hypothetical protein PENSTE_c002G10144 [Penicillium steckii]|uniref:Uncharacterized protein n=1 Tax=Penicillium steckii TaxID=303698 RepID=A0A1V6TSV5_9EURO|nr:hypothetical protein PENSTE_c002G10144 [Penicillium steckii]